MKQDIFFHRERMSGLLVVSAVAATLLGACADKPLVLRKPIVPAASSVSVAALPSPSPQKERQQAPQKLPSDWQQRAADLTLADVVDIALANNTLTRSSWLAARSAAADVGVMRSAYLPTVDVDAGLGHVSQSAVGGTFTFSNSTYDAAGTLQWLLFDFGGRSARLKEAWAALVAADWSHNASIQFVILSVQAAYYQYLNAKAQLSAAGANVHEAEVNLEAARKRKEVGLATVADVLQAQTALSQARLAEQALSGLIMSLRGQLATAMGIPANTTFELGHLPADVPAEDVAEAVEPLIDKAIAARPDMAAARWEAEKAHAHLKSVKTQGLPSFSGMASANRTYYLPEAFGRHDNNWSAALMMHVPLFTGFAHTHEVRKAQAEAESSLTHVDAVSQQVILDVWNGFADLTTAAQRVETSRDLLASATQAEKVALARYKQGVGNILDLLTAQAALSDARAQEIQARSDWFLAVAHLAYATGALVPQRDHDVRLGTATSGDSIR